MIYIANRASAILYHFLKRKTFTKPFLIPANACPVVPLVFKKAGVDFDFVDIDETHAMSKEQAIEKINSVKYAGIIFIHAYGKIFDNKIFYNELKERHPDLCLIDDRCLCPPDLSGKQPENVDLVLYSTGYAKYVELLYGGYGVTQQNLNIHDECFFREYYETKLQKYLKQCISDRRIYEWPASYPWLNTSPLEFTQKKYFDTIREKIAISQAQRNLINQIYRSHLPSEIQWDAEYDNWRFMISINRRDKILKTIFQNQLFAGANYPSVAYMFKRQSAPHAEEEARYTLNLFNNHKANESFALNICEIINSYL